ncbi:hypothetical protein ACG3SL_01275 [Sphingomonas sp. CJ20]
MQAGMRIAAALAAGVALAGIARAEVLEMTGEFPANYREASMARSVAIDRIGGQDGPALALAIERALQGTHFDVLAGRTGRATAEASIAGAVSTDVNERPYKKTEKRCTAKDDKGKCTKEEKVEVPCRVRTIDVGADLRMAREADGRIVYSANKPFHDETRWCEKERPWRTVEQAVSAGLGEIAGSVRLDIAARTETYRIRVLEGTKGMPRDVADRFKALVKLTKRDPAGACAGWAAMSGAVPEHPSIAFNVALCAEQAGAYERAVTLYGRAAALGADEAREGQDRATRLIAGRDDARARARRG